MNKNDIQKALNQKYDREIFKNLTNSLFEDCNFFLDPKKISTGNEKVLDFAQLGNVKLKDDKNLAIFEVKLRKNVNIYKNKIELRNLTTKYIDQINNHGVFVIYDNQSDDYRLTFATKYSEINEDGQLISKETDTKRFSYLLGKNESCRTPSERLEILNKNKNDQTLSSIIEAFNVDKITDEFFSEYKESVLKIIDELKNIRKKDTKININFIQNNISNDEFAKKILSQFVFLYFLQKKGWLGIQKNENGDFKKWGEGPKNFVKLLFEGYYCKYNNFFNDILEPLFVSFSEDLTDNYFSKLDCKIPFLNGGLFEPIKNYNWSETDLIIDNKIFENIINIFDKYNFTIQEEDPLDREVAIDPEMLGKVFENLLNIKDRKSKGAFYTPRNIVRYICKESIEKYLFNELENIDRNIIYALFKYKKDNNRLKKISFNTAQKIDNLLKNIKIYDPAIGSGAFPVELMNFIVNARLYLNLIIKNNRNTNYNLKRNFIEFSLFGNDIDGSATETAKLRLWLSLIIEEKDYEAITTLPNLDYKITIGDSLVSTKINLLNYQILDQITILKNNYVGATNIRKKNKIKTEINKLYKEILLEDFFDIKTNFHEVFIEKGGFDIVLGNPPYFQIQKLSKTKYQNKLKKEEYATYDGFGDIYCLFFERGFSLLNNVGVLCYITSNKWLKTSYGEKLRKFFTNSNIIEKVIDFRQEAIFKTASVDTSIVLLSKINKNINSFHGCLVKENLKNISIEEYFLKNSVLLENLSSEPWSIVNKNNKTLLDYISNLNDKKNIIDWSKISIFRGLLTGLNKVFIINDDLKNQFPKKEQKIFEKILRGSCLENLTFKWDNNWIINSHNGYNKNQRINVINNYPKIYEYLSKYKKELTKRQDKGDHWSNLRNCAYMESFKLPKVAWMNMNRKWKFSFIPENYMIEASLNFIADKKYAKYFTCILSSNVHLWFFRQVGRIFDDGGYMTKIETIKRFPIPIPNDAELNTFNTIVDNTIINKNNLENYYNEINDNTYKIYELNRNQINIIENDLPFDD